MLDSHGHGITERGGSFPLMSKSKDLSVFGAMISIIKGLRNKSIKIFNFISIYRLSIIVKHKIILIF